MEPHEFKETVLRLAHVSYTLNDKERLQALKISHTIRNYLRRNVSAALMDNRYEPTLCAYLSDNWGATCFERISTPIPGTRLIITRNGKFRHELLLHEFLLRGFLAMTAMIYFSRVLRNLWDLIKVRRLGIVSTPLASLAGRYDSKGS